MHEYFDNIGLIHLFAKQLGVSAEDMDDFLQEAYLGVVESKSAFENNKCSTVSILRMSTKHRWFLHCLNNKYVCRMTYDSFKKGTENYLGYLPIAEEINVTVFDDVDSVELWCSIFEIVGELNGTILYMRFKEDASFSEIAIELSLSEKAVSKRYYRSLQKLKEHKELLV